MSYFSDPQAIMYRPEISPKQTDRHFKTVISFSQHKQSLKKKINHKNAKFKTCKKQSGRKDVP